MNSLQLVRQFSSTACNCGKKTFKKFSLFEMRGPKQFKKERAEGKFPELEHRNSRGVREPFLMKDGQQYIANVEEPKDRWRSTPYPSHWEVQPNQTEQQKFITRAIWEHENFDGYEKEFYPEMVPELIVPDLEGFKLQPYVSYKVPDVHTEEFTAQDLFHAVYTYKVVDDFKENKINEDCSSKEPSPEELLDADEAKIRALQTGSDYI